MRFYTYLWLREDGTPYYVGKGTGRRARRGNHGRLHPPPDPSRIVILPCKTEEEAFEVEKDLIRRWGRKDIGTGCLYNFTNGGEGAAGHKQSAETIAKRMSHGVSPETRAKISAANKGRKHAFRKRHPHSPKTIAKIKKAKESISVETRTKLSQVARNRNLTYLRSPTINAKRSAALRGRSPSLETRAKIAAALRGVPFSPERKANIALGQMGKMLRGPKHPMFGKKNPATAERNRQRQWTPEMILKMTTTKLFKTIAWG